METCPQCGKKKHVFVTVEHAKKEMRICSGCWRECLDRSPLGNIPKRYRNPDYEPPAAA